MSPGEFSSFRVANVDVNLFDFGAFEALLHVNALSGGGSTKYTTGPSPVPLPAAGLLLVGALGGLGLVGRRRRQVDPAGPTWG